jgi:hypothetical protein
VKRKIILIVISLIFIICAFIITSCFTYGRPDSIFVNFVGRDLDNLKEFDRINGITISNMNLKIVYIKREFIEMGPPETRTRGNYLVTHLTIKHLYNDSEEITIFTKKHGINPGTINRVIIDKENQRLFFTVDENVDSIRGEYLYFYDLVNNQILNRILILNRERGAFISNVIFDKINNKIFFEIGRNYISLDIISGNIEEITQNVYKDILEYLNIIENNFTYTTTDNITMRIFTIIPFSDYLPANFKHKYNGTYINDGKNNIRISRNTNYLTRNIFWLEDGKYVLNGSYLFDTSGRMNEVKVIDGEILAIF